MHTKPLFNKLGILAFKNLFNYLINLETFKTLKSRTPKAYFSCMWCQLEIINYTIGDIFGEFTSVNYNGNSVVDYMAVSAGLADNVVSFKVGNFTAYSDHKPCHCTLNINHDFISGEELLARLDDVPIKYKWINENGESKQRLKVLQSTCCQTPEDVKNLNNECWAEQKFRICFGLMTLSFWH